MGNHEMSGSWRLAGLLVAGVLTSAQAQQPVTQPARVQQPHVATFSHAADTVIDALTAVLLARGEADSAAVRGLRTNALAAIAKRAPGRINGQSVRVGRPDLERMVPDAARRHITDAGGRYVVSVIVEPTPDGRTRVTVVPTIIASVPGSEGPLGGRPLRSNGTLETAFLQALTSRLQR